MNSFQGLLQAHRDLPVGEQQEAVEARLPELAARVGFRVWNPGDSIRVTGRRVLIGVAPYSPLDLRLLDEITPFVSANPETVSVDLFNVRDVRQMGDFEAYVPGIGAVLQPPVAGLWVDGHLVQKATGSRAR